MDGDLDVELIGDAQAGVDGGRRGAPVFVQLQAHGAGVDLLAQRLGQAGVALAEEAEVHREVPRRPPACVDVPGPGVQVVA